MNNYSVIGGPTSETLAKKIAKRLHAKCLRTTLRVFPDGESKLTVLDQVPCKTTVVVSSTGPPVDSNLIQTLSLISKSREMSSDVITVMPYMGYAKQDKEFLRGEIITLSVVAKLLKAAGATRLILVDFHSPEAMGFFKIPTKNLSSTSLFAKFFKSHKLRNPLVVSPDVYWKSNAKEFAGLIGAKATALNKQRNRKSGKLVIKSPPIKFEEKCDLILLDDMVSTGASIVKAIQFLKRSNFRKIYVACTHPVFVGDSERKIKKAGVNKIIGTNSIEGKLAQIDLSQIIANTILDWN
ncbi:MAG: ribose-phosphate diphosphokinase [Nitrosopumilus sp.]|uniref:ribose-phosphate diphosphokinase n=1 Tax=Nitrosopumilus sp. TaxID=2024843 RepID=UPI00292CC09D|nr:ribose-phosphate diphosphokinase [Nitrosopumilus sp.]